MSAAPPESPVVVPATADLVVIGAGLMGSATAWAATRRGLTVVLVEQFGIGHDRGSSHGSARIVRRAYPDPLYARLTGRAFDLWDELESAGGTPLLRMTGGIDHGSARDVGRIAAVLAGQGVEHRRLGPGEAAGRWPGMEFTTDVLFHPQAGTVDAGAAVQVAAGLVERAGATVAPWTRVHSVGTTTSGDGIVRTDRGDVRAPRVVVAAGAWLGPLLAQVAGTGVPLPPLEVTQQQVFHFARRRGVAEWPVTVHKETPGSRVPGRSSGRVPDVSGMSTYSLPGGSDGGPDGARKVAEHHAPVPGSLPTTAEHRSGEVDPAARERITAYVQRWLPGLVPEPFAETTCLYTSTANEDFVLDRVGPFVLCSPCSGHGAKFAPLIGELATDLVLGTTRTCEPSVAEQRFALATHLGRAPIRAGAR